jgi:two-component system, OmpR family, sensor histidine kinase TctE
MTRTISLRARLVLIILTPLMLISVALGLLTLRDANERATQRFDRSLLSTVLAISRDTALSGGDALSAKTLALLGDTSGGPVFYHVYAPNGAYVTGYATPPVLPLQMVTPEQNQNYFDAIYQRRPVRALRFVDKMSIEGLSGDFTFTVWQDTALRDSFVSDTTQRIFGMIAIIMAALTLIVWFGVRIGLRPLLDLQDAISQRSPRELNEIRRPVPIEVSGIVRTLNELLSELRATFTAKDEFISNAAHQLRNPIAGVLAMSEAMRSATKISDVKERGDELVLAAKSASDLANSLLAFERAISPKPNSELRMIDVNETLRQIKSQALSRAEDRGIALTFTYENFDSRLRADPILLQQGVLNLIDNSLLHGGEKLSKVTVKTLKVADAVHVIVADDGRGIPADQIEKAMARFGQVEQSSGSGLGLPIAIAVSQNLGGDLQLESAGSGLTATMILPIWLP